MSVAIITNVQTESRMVNLIKVLNKARLRSLIVTNRVSCGERRRGPKGDTWGIAQRETTVYHMLLLFATCFSCKFKTKPALLSYLVGHPIIYSEENITFTHRFSILWGPLDRRSLVRPKQGAAH